MYIEEGIAAGQELQELKIIRSTLISGSIDRFQQATQILY